MDSKQKPDWGELHLYYQYIKDIDKYSLLSKAEEKELLQKARENDPKAIHRLVCANLKFVINVAFKYRGQGFSLPELINEGNIGLIEAAKRFDVNKKIRFISYAVWWIRQAITRAIAEKARMVRISAEKELILRRINRHSVKTQFNLGGGMTIDAEDLGNKMGYERQKMEKILEMGQSHSSLDMPMGNGSDASMMDLIANGKEDPPDFTAIVNSRNSFLHKSLEKLGETEKKVLKLYFGIDNQEGLSLKDIGEIVGLSKERVRQIKEEGLASLRDVQWPKDLLLAA